MTIITALFCCLSDCHRWQSHSQSHSQSHRIEDGSHHTKYTNNQSMARESAPEESDELEFETRFSTRFRSSVRSLVCFHMKNKWSVRLDSKNRSQNVINIINKSDGNNRCKLSVMESQSHIVCEGWLTKSPPEKRIMKTKWRRRWFVLKLSGQIPGQYVLQYYADSTRRKLKGTIDLDQCEQVDAGLQLESRKENFQHMFDVRTSKRTYYLVAKSEIEMNKWVECICSVCGLKIHVEEGADDRYSPQPSQEFSFSASNSNSSTNSAITTITALPQTQTPETMRSSNVSRVSVTQIEGPSGPYIPISECHTGKPINGSVIDIDMNSVPQLPTKITRAVSDECYDIPRQLNPLTDSNENNSKITVDLLDRVPKAPISSANNKLLRNSVDSALTNPPKVNWSTYPRDSPDSFNSNDVTRTSIRSCNASVDVSTRHCSVNDSGFDTQRSSSPLSSEFSRDSTISNDSNVQPPPRPPKPPSLRKSKSKSESCASLPNVSSLYDVPVTSFEQNIKPDEEPSPTCRVPSASTASISDNSPKSPDELYDFPRMRSDSTPVNDPNERDSDFNINTAVPIAFDRSSLKSSKKHSYTNAPPGYFVNKETVFNYEYRPTLTSSVEDNSVSFQNKLNSAELEASQADRSPLTPNSASYNNLPISSSLPNSLSVGPPAVNRDLKPRRKGSDSDASNTALPSPTMKTVTTIQLQPPPALTRIHSAPTKRSFRKPRTPGQSQVTINGTPPRIPSRSLQYQHNRDPSTSEDDISLCGNGSRRNSANDEQQAKPTFVPPPRRHFDGCEIQYLDLDLDSDSNSQSPRTPNEHHNHQRSNSTLSNKEFSANNSQTQPPLSSGSTVYKTVDFLKTEAFNKMRLNVETYRNSQ